MFNEVFVVQNMQITCETQQKSNKQIKNEENI